MERAVVEPDETLLHRWTLMLVPPLVASTTGCAALFNGTRESVHIESLPSGADLTVGGTSRGTTPNDVMLSRAKDQTVIATKDGYQEGHATLTRSGLVGWFVWDIGTCVIPVTLCIPVVVDAISNAWFSYDDDAFTIRLKPNPPGPQAPPATIAPPAPVAPPVAPAPTATGLPSTPY